MDQFAKTVPRSPHCVSYTGIGAWFEKLRQQGIDFLDKWDTRREEFDSEHACLL